ncbi:MAG: SRPBCC domain-containing protein [Thermomicrobiales bacterium]
MDQLASSRTSRIINASAEVIYHACIDPAALETWMAPGGMIAKVLAFDERLGGGYRMSLRYPDSEPTETGKSGEREDRYTARFEELTPPKRIVETITFDTTDAAFSGEMIMTITLEERSAGTEVTFLFEHLPPGVRPEDNDAGTRSSLEKLATYVEGKR